MTFVRTVYGHETKTREVNGLCFISSGSDGVQRLTPHSESCGCLE